jgi:hypothetical protein
MHKAPPAIFYRINGGFYGKMARFRRRIRKRTDTLLRVSPFPYNRYETSAKDHRYSAGRRSWV